ncbi:TonB-dependent receptor domain-containing protein [uncultured Megasphaera sp.]|uniref:TonB-dependent receptor domain-containing protein n=1 Tax=uncultured Megasphaera sp. TaxID=165188 RepID=UPI0025E54983|nr:TonB-dependent receptor [uncultured Megasphaera sp.]
MKKWVRKKGRVAAGVSISLHAAVYLSLAAGGFFTLLSSYTRQGDVTDIMVYDAGDVGGSGGENDQSTPSVSRAEKPPLIGEVPQSGGGVALNAAAPEPIDTVNAAPADDQAIIVVGAAIPAARPDQTADTSSDNVGENTPQPVGAALSAARSGTDGTGRNHDNGTGTGRGTHSGSGTGGGHAGGITVPAVLADFLDRIRENLPVTLSEAEKAPQPDTSQPAAALDEAPPEVPPKQSNTTIVTAREMEAHHDVTVQDALQRVTGVTVNEMVPGVSSYVKLNGDDRVLILVDGQNLANAQGSGYGRGSVDLTTLPGVGAIDHIEVTKGSGSVRYGSGAVGGVINIVTKKGDRSEATLDAYTGSWGRHGLTLTHEGRAGKTSWLFNGSIKERQYFGFPNGMPTDSSHADYHNTSAFLRVNQELKGHNRLTFETSHDDFHGHSATFWARGKYGRIDRRADYWYPRENKVVERLINNYSLTWKFQTDKDTPGFLRYFNDYQRTHWTNHYFTRSQGLEWQNNWQLGPYQHLTAGAEWTEDMGTNYEAHYFDKKRHNQAIYLEDALTFGKFTLTPGLRWDNSSTYGVHQTPRLAMNYKANKAFNVYASWSRVFSPPRLNDQFYITSTSHGNENLQPEEGYTQTLGFQYQAGPKTSLEGSIFHSNLENVIRWNRTSSYSEAENLNEEDKRGFELTWKQKVNDKWDYEAGYSYIHTKVDQGKGDGLVYDTSYNQPNGYHAGVHYQSGKWQAAVDMTAGTGRNDTYYRNNSYVVWNASASYAPDKSTTIYARVNNFNDESYDLYHNYPAAGRNWQIGVKKKF